MIDQSCDDCGTAEEVFDQWECWEEVPLCARCVDERFAKCGGVPDEWRIDRD